MKNNNLLFGCIAALAATVVFTIAIAVRDGRGGAGDQARGPASINPAQNNVSVEPTSNGDEMVVNASENYYFSMPTNWYLETSTIPASFTIYPDYEPKSGNAPTCKIEFSTLSASSSLTISLNNWVTRYLHSDPTAAVNEASRTSLVVGGASAIKWQGNVNGIPTTLMYLDLSQSASNAATSSSVLEMAPSTLTGDDDCNIPLEALLNNFNLGHYEP